MTIPPGIAECEECGARLRGIVQLMVRRCEEHLDREQWIADQEDKVDIRREEAQWDAEEARP